MSESNTYSPEDIRKLSHTVLHAAEKGRKSLFERLTKNNADKIQKMMEQKPIFFETQENQPQIILLDDEVSDAFPAEFFENPTQWIESQAVVDRGDNHELPQGDTIQELWENSYDITKVRQFSLETSDQKQVKIISKRLNRSGMEEVALAQRAYEAGIPTPKVLGEIYDKGNVYAFFEYIEGINLSAARDILLEGEHKFNVVEHLDYLFCRACTFEEYEGELQSLLSKSQIHIEEPLKRELDDLWKAGEEDRWRMEILFELKNFLFPRIEQERIVQIERYRDFVKNPIVQALAIEILYKLGFSSVDDFFHRVKQLDTLDVMQMYLQNEDLISQIDYLREECSPQRLALAREAAVLLRTHLYGFNPEEEKEQVLRQCQRAGIEHKDFENRNFVLPWDFKENKPRIVEEGKPRLYLIDWEQKSNSLKRKDDK